MTTRPIAACIALALLVACGGRAPPAPTVAISSPSSVAAGQQLNELVEGYFEAYLKLNPVAATFIGDHRYDDRLPPANYRQQTRATEQRFLDQLASVDRASLAPKDELNYEVFEYGRRIALENLAFPGDLLPLDQFNNPASFFAQLGSGQTVQPFVTVKDYDNFAARMQLFPAWADGAIAAMREGVKRGVVQPRVVVLKTIPQLTELIARTPEDSVFWRPIRTMPESIPADERKRITDHYREAITTAVVPAYRRLRDFTRDEYLPAARASIGLSALPDGARWYACLVRSYTTTDTPVEEIHQTGLREVARIGFKGDVKALADSMRRDRRFYFSKPEQLLDAYRAQLARVTAAVPKLFTLMPKSAIQVRPVESFREQSAAGAEYYQPTADGTRPGIFYVNTYDLPARPSYEIETIFLHEAIPGHHFQIALAIENPDLPRFRRFGSDDAFSALPDISTAYVEGWGLYAESLGDELGLYTDPYQKLGNLFAESWRAARLVVDTGMHAKGWSRDQAIDFMLAHTAAGRTDVVAEIERYIAWPGQALAYKTGQMKIRELRERASRQLGARFDVREFHAQILADGALPLAVLEAKIDRWIKARAAAAPGRPDA
jgi:uncharacterized protein (DUF885 family)